jgi:hypothetical protein
MEMTTRTDAFTFFIKELGRCKDVPKIVDDFFCIIVCVIVCRKSRNQHLNVSTTGGVATWSPMRDKGWRAYSTARDQLHLTWPELSRVMGKLNLL